MPDTQALTTTLFGKIPTQGDFVRTGRLGEAQTDFEEWLSLAVQQSRGALPAAPVRFVFSAPTGERLIGLFVASLDAVGRAFPLAMLHRVPGALTAHPSSLLVALYDDFLDAVEASLVSLQASAFELFAASLRGFQDPAASAVVELLRGAREVLESETVAAFATRVLGDESSASLAYALHVLQQSTAHGLAPVVLDAPIREELDVYVWLELLRASAHGRDAVALLWSLELRRALLSTGPLSEYALAFLLEPEHASQKRWPLRSRQRAADDQARSALGAQRCKAVDAATTLHALISAVAGSVTV